MWFRFVSQQLTFEEGEVSVERDLSSGGPLSVDLGSVRLRMDRTEDVAGVVAGKTQLLITNCLVRSRRTSLAHRVPVFRLTTSISDGELAAGVAQVFVGFHAFARIVAVDMNDDVITRSHLLGVALPAMSVEVNGPEHTPLHVLLPPGEYSAYLAGPRPVQVRFIVHEHEEDAGTVMVRDFA